MANVNFPRVKLTVAGQSLNINHALNHQNGYFHGDKISASVPIWGNGSNDLEWWANLPENTSVQLITGTGSASGATTWNPTPIFDGILTDLNFDLLNGNVEVQCTDRVQLLVQYKLYEAFPNQTGAQIIQTLAGKVGMTAQITGANHLAGPIYSQNHMKLQHGDFSKATTAWDLICDIARQSGNVAFVKGNTVYVQPNNPDLGSAWEIKYSPPIVNGSVMTWNAPTNVYTLNVHHNFLAAKDITVQVKGFHSGKGQSFTASAGPQKNRTTANQSNFVYGPYPNLSQAQAQAKANAIYRDLTIHEWTLQFEAEPDYSLTPYKTITLGGVTGNLQSTYYVHELSFHLTQDEGSMMMCTAKTFPPTNETNPS